MHLLDTLVLLFLNPASTGHSVCCWWSEGLRPSMEGQVGWGNQAWKACSSLRGASDSFRLPTLSTSHHKIEVWAPFPWRLSYVIQHRLKQRISCNCPHNLRGFTEEGTENWLLENPFWWRAIARCLFCQHPGFFHQTSRASQSQVRLPPRACFHSLIHDTSHSPSPHEKQSPKGIPKGIFRAPSPGTLHGILKKNLGSDGLQKAYSDFWTWGLLRGLLLRHWLLCSPLWFLGILLNLSEPRFSSPGNKNNNNTCLLK